MSGTSTSRSVDIQVVRNRSYILVTLIARACLCFPVLRDSPNLDVEPKTSLFGRGHGLMKY